MRVCSRLSSLVFARDPLTNHPLEYAHTSQVYLRPFSGSTTIILYSYISWFSKVPLVRNGEKDHDNFLLPAELVLPLEAAANLKYMLLLVLCQGTVVLRVSIRFVMMLTQMWRRFESRSRLFFCRSDRFDIPAGDQKVKTKKSSQERRSAVTGPAQERKAGAATRDGKTSRLTWIGHAVRQIKMKVRFKSD